MIDRLCSFIFRHGECKFIHLRKYLSGSGTFWSRSRGRQNALMTDLHFRQKGENLSERELDALSFSIEINALERQMISEQCFLV